MPTTYAAAEITRLREQLAFANDQRRMMADIVTNPDPEVESLRLLLAAWKAEAKAWRQLYDMRPDDDENFETFSARRDIARIKVAKARASTDAIEKEEANGN